MTDLFKKKDGENDNENGDGSEESVDEVEESAGSKVTQMKAGEYVLHVLIETGKNIDLEGEDTVDPMITINFMGKSK